MLTGRTRFYLAAGMFGAIAGELLAAALVFVFGQLVEWAVRPLLLVLLVGVVGGAWAGVALMRRSYRREARR